MSILNETLFIIEKIISLSTYVLHIYQEMLVNFIVNFKIY